MLRRFELRDGDARGRPVGTLSYDTKDDRYHMSIDRDIDAAELPLSLEIFAANGKRELADEDCLRWIRGRICPPSRHNIRGILRELNLPEYSEFGLLEYTMARCDKDGLYMVEI